jgi:hypothetical protein
VSRILGMQGMSGYWFGFMVTRAEQDQ